MERLTIKDLPKLPRKLERKVENYIVGIENVYISSPYHFPRGDVYIAHQTGKEKEVNKWKPTLKNPFRKIKEKIKEEEFRLVAKNISLTGMNPIGDIKLKIANEYGKIIENGILEEWLNPFIKQYKDYRNKIVGM